MEAEEILPILERRIARALFTLKKLKKRDGGPAWIAAQRLFDSELGLVMDHLYGKTDDQPVYGATETKGKNMSENITKIVPDMPSFSPVPPGAPTGWICPKCGTVMGPHVRVCQMCSVPAYIVRSPGTHGVPDVQG